MQAITITGNPRHPKMYVVTTTKRGSKYPLKYDASDAGEAAAKAVEWAANIHGGAGYVILGSKWVLELIPEQLRFAS